MRWAGHVASTGKGEAYTEILLRKPEGKRPLGRPRCRWEDNNNKMGLQEVGSVGMNWSDLAQDRYRWRAFVNVVMNLVVP